MYDFIKLFEIFLGIAIFLLLVIVLLILIRKNKKTSLLPKHDLIRIMINSKLLDHYVNNVTDYDKLASDINDTYGETLNLSIVYDNRTRGDIVVFHVKDYENKTTYPLTFFKLQD